MAATPKARERFGELCGAAWPATASVPESAVTAPVMILMRVDLPAPFSPTRAWTSPARSSNETSRSAVSPEYDLLMDVACKSGGSGIGAQRSTGILADAGGAGFCVMIRHDRHRPHSS